MELLAIESLLASVVASPLLLAVACCSVLHVAACVLNIIWSVCAGYLLGEADFWTKLLPEKRAYWRNRVAWVTGSSSGVGLSLCRLLAQRGCRLIMSSRKMDDLQAAKQDVVSFCGSRGLQKSESDFLLLPFDLNNLESFETIVKDAISWSRDGRIDFLFNNAGISSRGMFMSYDATDKILTIDLLAQIKLTKLVLPNMAKGGFGHIIFTNSACSKLVTCGHEPYAVAKRGLLCFAEALSREFKAKNMNIAVTTAILGYVRTSIGSRTLGPTGKALTDDSSYMNPYVAAGMPPDTVAKLMLKGGSNKLRECWIANNPTLVSIYLQACVPGLISFLLDLRAEAHAAAVEEEVRELEEIAQRVRQTCPHA
ncbi:oxidoreductase, short chain dehydrogenase/reductase family protein [Besnoitia besnoiti]|uniref:Oxidoreductase, short chain dehydrogenase/reductase family protein n=1 Tax=Besnoitia besnoiti TaxID=94643 RepID=A0A2A9MAM7_BESBE|nr:oxidoreductase, short chain dehydrogenase/reductase family protein [Besnoitia besnoiti]PFH34254.1 oxidoreductase, short chain dehydrogenase/reductase family protein [Besnoitia besnoiti]